MKVNFYISLKWLYVFAAFNGILFGVVVEVVRRIYTPIFLDYYLRLEIDSASQAGRSVVSTSTYLGDYIQLPLLSTVVFIGIVPPMFQFFKKLGLPLTVWWQLMGVCAMTVFVAIHSLIAPWEHHTDLLTPFWRWAFCFCIVSSLNFIYGLAIYLCMRFSKISLKIEI